MLRSRFQSLPGAFNACLIPEENNEKPKGIKATFSRKFAEVFNVLVFNVILILFVCSSLMLKIYNSNSYSLTFADSV